MTPEIGYKLTSEQHGPRELIAFAQKAERAGFAFAMISDHFHPWTHRQGHSPFVWAVIGGIAQSTRQLRLGTGVTCPIMRIHPAIVAQAAATAAVMMPDRFLLGLGTGENLNEHVLGQRWPAPDVRLEMIEEAIKLVRVLWRGGLRSYRGRYYQLEQAELYTLPDHLPPILLAAGGPRTARVAGRVADGLIVTSPSRQLVDAFREAGGVEKPVFGEMAVAWAEDDEIAARTALEVVADHRAIRRPLIRVENPAPI